MVLFSETQGSPRRLGQPWAGGQNPVGVPSSCLRHENRLSKPSETAENLFFQPRGAMARAGSLLGGVSGTGWRPVLLHGLAACATVLPRFSNRPMDVSGYNETPVFGAKRLGVRQSSAAFQRSARLATLRHDKAAQECRTPRRFAPLHIEKAHTPTRLMDSLKNWFLEEGEHLAPLEGSWKLPLLCWIFQSAHGIHSGIIFSATDSAA